MKKHAVTALCRRSKRATRATLLCTNENGRSKGGRRLTAAGRRSDNREKENGRKIGMRRARMSRRPRNQRTLYIHQGSSSAMTRPAGQARRSLKSRGLDRVGSGLVASAREVFKISRVGPGHHDRTQPDLRGLPRPANSPGLHPHRTSGDYVWH